MKPRTWLIILQVLGGLSVLAYPGVLIASVMALGSGSDQTSLFDWPLRIFFVFTLVYPFAWIILWFLSWHALRRQRVARAMLLSTPPALVTAAFALFIVTSTYEAQRFGQELDRVQDNRAEKIREQKEPK